MGVIGGQIYGAKKYIELGKILRQGWLLAIVVAIPLTLVMWNISPVLLFFKQDKHLVLLTQNYFHILAFSVSNNVYLKKYPFYPKYCKYHDF